jgi:hypothetical protein
MAYTVQYMLLADSVQQIDQGKLNILGTFDQITVPTLPVRQPGMVIVALLVAETEDELGEHQFGVRIMRPNGKQVTETGTTMRVVPAAGSWKLAPVRLVIGLAGLPLREYGRHQVELLVDGEVIGKHPLTVAKPPDESGA